jgi:hypothetical protein
MAAVGAPAQAKEALPAKPLPGINRRVKVAVWPAVTVAAFEPGAAGEIVSAGAIEALRPIVCGEFGASSVIAMNAAREPVVRDERDTPIVQFAPTA